MVGDIHAIRIVPAKLEAEGKAKTTELCQKGSRNETVLLMRGAIDRQRELNHRFARRQLGHHTFDCPPSAKPLHQLANGVIPSALDAEVMLYALKRPTLVRMTDIDPG